MVKRTISRNIDCLGGVHPTILPEETVSNQYIEIVVKGDGELTFKDLVERVANYKEIYDIKGICFKDKNGNIVNNPEA